MIDRKHDTAYRDKAMPNYPSFVDDGEVALALGKYLPHVLDERTSFSQVMIDKIKDNNDFYHKHLHPVVANALQDAPEGTLLPYDEKALKDLKIVPINDELAEILKERFPEAFDSESQENIRHLFFLITKEYVNMRHFNKGVWLQLPSGDLIGLNVFMDDDAHGLVLGAFAGYSQQSFRKAVKSGKDPTFGGHFLQQLAEYERQSRAEVLGTAMVIPESTDIALEQPEASVGIFRKWLNRLFNTT